MRRLSDREGAFVLSLKRHGFRFIKNIHGNKNLKRKKGYIAPSTAREDASGIDFWVKLPFDDSIFPIQVTQRGTKLMRMFAREELSLMGLDVMAQKRISNKKKRAHESGIVFVLLRDCPHATPQVQTMWGDRKALFYGARHGGYA